MTPISRRWFGRATVGFGAAMALIVVTAGPASADLPEGNISGDITGGNISINDVDFPLGGDPPPDDDCATGDPSVLTATVGARNGSGVATVSNVNIDFDRAEIDEVFGTPICAEIVLQNSPAGTQVSNPADPDPETGTVTIDGPAPVVDVLITGVGIPSGCRLDNIDLDVNTGTADDALDGTVSHAGAPAPWSLTLTQGDDDTNTTNGANVPDPTSCGIFAGPIESALGGLPSQDTGITMTMTVTEVP